MRLFLASFRTPEGLESVAELAGPRPRVGVISNAVDFIPDEARAEYARKVFDPLAAFREIGAQARDLDLRRYFGRPGELAAALDGLDLVWVTGGNAFLLMTAMRRSGFDAAIRARLAADAMVYGGWSAGAVVAGPDLTAIDLMDPVDCEASGYRAEPRFDALGLIDVRIVPHYRSKHPESPAAEAVVEALAARGLAHQPLRDGEAMIVCGERIEISRPAAAP